MKEIRHPKTARISKGKGKASAPPKPGRSPGSIDTFEAPPISAGEDIHSFERHNQILKAQYTKPHANQQIVSELMQITFAMRRADILNFPCEVAQIFKKYPFLQTEHVSEN